PIVGREAARAADQTQTAFSAKRFMGSEQRLVERNAAEISADILSYLKRETERNLGQKIDAAVITVPAHFSDLQRTATKQAASIAGLKVLRLVNEPTAAAVAFGLDKNENGIFAVYDFGGGTFDFSVLRLTDGIFQVLATGGDNYLGGDDIDNEILKYNCKLCGIDFDRLSESEKISGRLAAKFLKENLGDSPEIAKNYQNCEFKLSQGVLKKVSRDFLLRSLEISDRVLSDANITPAELSGVVMVGGMTKLNLVKETARGHFGARIFDNINPEEAVAFGAAIYADSIAQKNSKMLLIDVVSLTLGIETFGGGVDRIIHRNTPIPIVEKREYTTYENNQTGIKFRVVQGERPIASECRSLANFELTGIPPMPAGEPRVEVAFSVDVNGLLSVEAREKTTGVRQTIIVDPSSGLSNEEMIAILKKAAANREKDSIKVANIDKEIEIGRMDKLWESIV
ncbi:MAG: Hsp70 family protein, partial [Holosporaceae bacterium]|nr:Hsp70 family protein [Holosporaceae bacterium]